MCRSLVTLILALFVYKERSRKHRRRAIVRGEAWGAPLSLFFTWARRGVAGRVVDSTRGARDATEGSAAVDPAGRRRRRRRLWCASCVCTSLPAWLRDCRERRRCVTVYRWGWGMILQLWRKSGGLEWNCVESFVLLMRVYGFRMVLAFLGLYWKVVNEEWGESLTLRYGHRRLKLDTITRLTMIRTMIRWKMAFY